MSPEDETNGWSRRAVFGGLGAGIVGAGLLGGVASAAPTRHGIMTGALSTIMPQAATQTALSPNLRYVLLCGHDMAPLESPSSYTTLDGRFRFAGASSGYASVLLNLPTGTVIKELEMYGIRGAAGAVSLELWKSTVLSGAVALSGQVATPVAAGEFTVTVAVDDLQNDTFKSTPFASIDAAAAPTTQIYGIRVGYTTPTLAFTPIDPARVYDSRIAGYAPNNGLMAPNTNRVVPVRDGRNAAGAVVAANVVPEGAVAVAINVTVASPTGPNFLSVVPGDAAGFTASTINWPGGFDAANGAIVKLDGSRQLKVFCGDQAGSTHVIVDVTGYYR
jgi:hypothetical protein